MTFEKRKCSTAVAVALVLVAPLTGLSTASEKPLTAAATEEEIAARVRELSDPSFRKRTYATRRLCAIGAPARRRLQEAARGDDAETALRAGAVLAVLDRLMFQGVELRLSPSRTRITWDEPLDMNITMTNRSMYPARVPFELDPAGRTAATSEARQVGDMLDLAEWLLVLGPDTRRINLNVDDIAADATVVAAVQQRLNGEPAETLRPGESVTITARAFNRGWARYRLLDPGVYTLAVEYMPEWDDDVLAAQRVGRVVGNQVQVTVTRGAPDAVSRRGEIASLAVERAGRFIIATLTNRTDQTMTVNRNFGGPTPFADGRWVYELNDTRRDVPVWPKRGAGDAWKEFDPALLDDVKAGCPIELARIAIDDLRRGLAGAGADLDNARWTVHFAYTNLCDRKWQLRQGSALVANPNAPKIFRAPLPRHILAGRFTSNQLTAPAAD